MRGSNQAIHRGNRNLPQEKQSTAMRKNQIRRELMRSFIIFWAALATLRPPATFGQQTVSPFADREVDVFGTKMKWNDAPVRDFGPLTLVFNFDSRS